MAERWRMKITFDRHEVSEYAHRCSADVLALQEYQQRHYGLALNFLDGWQNQINHLLAQEEAHRRPLSDELAQTLKQISMAYVARCIEEEQTA